MNNRTTWGVVATIKAPTTQILNFAAHHLDLGAQRVHVYLDVDDPDARSALKRHPKCRVIHTDDGYWHRRRKHRGCPDGHQHRQTVNATHCYNRRPEVTWLLHADVDEFLWPTTPLAAQLDALPHSVLSARVRPIEALAPDPADPPPGGQIWCKGFARLQADRRAETNTIYPTYGDHLNGGFLSHVAGKIFTRTGQPDISLRIHNAFRGKVMDADPPDLSHCRLVHLHAHGWDHWQALYRYRLEHGSYRDGLKPAPRAQGAALNMHELFTMLEHDGGETALRAFYDEVCTATPALRDRLDRFGRLHAGTLDLDGKRARHFPHHA